ncbi:General transcription factor II-I repeat domain-containing protein 2-like 2, partial [Homarus americanus]
MNSEMQKKFVSLWKPVKDGGVLPNPGSLNSILCSRTVMLVAQNPVVSCQTTAWQKIEELISLLISAELLTPASLLEQCVALLRHTWPQHQTEIEGKLKLVLGSELRKEYVTKKREEFRRRQNVFVKKSCESLSITEASYEIALALAKKRKSFSDGEEIVKPCLQIFARGLGDKSIERKADEIALSKQTVMRPLDESIDICDVAQLSIFIRGIDDPFSVFEEFVSLESLHGKTRGSDIFDKVKSCLENLQLDSSKLITVCTDGAPSMIGKVAGTTTLLENFLNRPLLKYHCIIHQESLCGKTLNLQHVMLPVVKCVNKIRARALNRREFREYCEMLDLECGDLVLHCEVRWLSRGQLENEDLSQFPHLKEQSERAADNGNLTKYTEKIKLLQESFESRFRDFAKEEDCILTFINPFSLGEQKIMKMLSDIQMELIDLKTNSLLKMKFDELSSVPNASDMINFWQSLPCENFPELKKFAQSYICRFGTTYRCEQAFSSMKLIKSKTRSRLTDSNLKNSLLLSVTNLTPNIERLAKSKQTQKSH